MRLVHALLGPLALVLVVLLPADFAADPPEGIPEANARAALSPGFVPNAGHLDERVAYSARVPGGTAFVTRDGQVVYSVSPGRVLSETAIGGEAKPVGEDPTPTRVSRFFGDDPAEWQRDLPTFATVDLGTVWPGVRIRLSAAGATVEKIFTVEPGGDPDRIRMRVGGARGIEVAEAGSLRVRVGEGDVVFSAPRAWQDDRVVAAAYLVDGNEYGFSLGKHDPSRPVHIDPLLQGTFLGGSVNDRIYAMKVHPDTGLVYVAGTTWSTDFPGTAGSEIPAHRSDGANQDVFVAVLSADLETLIQATYYGGSSAGGPTAYAGDEEARALAFHPDRAEVWLTGFSTSSNLPHRTGNAQYDKAGEMDAFVAVFADDLKTVIGSTFLGGHGREIGNGIAFYDGPLVYEKWACITGETTSTDLPGIWRESLQSGYGGGTRDGFLARVRDDLAYFDSTYLGGSDDDTALGVAIDNERHVIYVVGETRSEDLPATVNGARDRLSGNSDGFLARFPRGLPTDDVVTYIGGSGDEHINTVFVHPGTGDVYFGGQTTSTKLLFVGGFQRKFGGGLRDGLVGRIGGELTRGPLLAYLGGSGDDEVRSMSIEGPTGWVYAAGETNSPDLAGNAPGAQSSLGGDQDAFVARMTGHLLDLPTVSYLGGTGREMGYAVSCGGGSVYVAGLTSTESGAWLASAGGAQASHGGWDWPDRQDGYVARFDASLLGVPTIAPTFEVAKGLVKSSGSGWKLQVKKGFFDPGWERYPGVGDDIRILVEGVEYFPPASRKVILKKKKLTIFDPANSKRKFTLSFGKWKYQLKLVDLPVGAIDPADGVDISISLMDRRCEVTVPIDPVKRKKMLPTTGVPE